MGDMAKKAWACSMLLHICTPTIPLLSALRPPLPCWRWDPLNSQLAGPWSLEGWTDWSRRRTGRPKTCAVNPSGQGGTRTDQNGMVASAQIRHGSVNTRLVHEITVTVLYRLRGHHRGF